MAHFAQLDNGVVTQVLVVNNDVITDNKGKEQEALGVAFLQSLFGADTQWVQTSYNNKFRKRYASIGHTYDAALDAFIPPKPYDSWILNTDTCTWIAPVPRPDDDAIYKWDEEQGAWILVSDE